MSFPDQMTNDQFPMTNCGGHTTRTALFLRLGGFAIVIVWDHSRARSRVILARGVRGGA
jgi:hypothetical protein